MSFSPDYLVFNSLQLLVSEKRDIVIKNTGKEQRLTVDDIYSSTPELIVFAPQDSQRSGGDSSITLQPGESITVTILIVPETVHLIQGCIFIGLNKRYVFMLPVTAFVIENQFGLKPLYYSDVSLGQKIKTPISIKNPYPHDIEVLEAYSTVDFVQLYWPNEKEVNASQDEPVLRDYSQFMQIPKDQQKVLVNAVFETDQLVDHQASIQILINQGILIRLPIYYHVYADLVKFTPSIADFGVVPINFDALRIPVTFRIRDVHSVQALYLTEVLLPLNDERLDFVMGNWDRELRGNIQVFNKNTQRLEEHRRAVVQGEQELFAFTILLKPSQYGLVDTKIKMTLQQEDGTVHHIDLPIVGLVSTSHSVMVEPRASNLTGLLRQKDQADKFLGFLPPSPAIVLDVSQSLIDQQGGTKILGQNLALFMSKSQQERLIIQNTFQTPTHGMDIYNPNQDFSLQYFSQARISTLKPDQTVQLGQFNFNLKDLTTSSGHKHFFVFTNSTFFPQYVQITDQKLVCSIAESYQPTRYQDCASGISLDFGRIGLYQPKHRAVNITNLGHETVLLDWVRKGNAHDELSLEYHDSFEHLKDMYPELKAKYFDEDLSRTVVDRFHDQQRLGLYILPGHTITLKFSLEGAMSSVHGGKASEKMQHSVAFSFLPEAYTSLVVNYTYQVVPGSMSLLPSNAQFEPGFVGHEQSLVLAAKSTFKIPVLIQSIASSDARFMPMVKNTVIAPGNETQIIDLVFDPGQSTTVQSFSLAVKSRPDSVDPHGQVSKNADIWQRVTNMEAQVQALTSKSTGQGNRRMSEANISNYTQLVSEALSVVSGDDVALWRSKKQKSLTAAGTWDSDVIEDIQATITIKTNIVDQIEVPVQGFVTEPKILRAKTLDFG